MGRDREINLHTYSRVRAREEGVEDSTEEEVAGAVVILKGGLAVPPGVSNIAPKPKNCSLNNMSNMTSL